MAKSQRINFKRVKVRRVPTEIELTKKDGSKIKVKGTKIIRDKGE